MSNQQGDKHTEHTKTSRRRNLLRIAGIVVISGEVGSCAPTTRFGKDGIPSTAGYIPVDAKKCQGRLSCMLACCQVHQGEANL